MARTLSDGYPALDDPGFFPGLGCLPDQEEPGSFHWKGEDIRPCNKEGRTISLETHLPSDTSGRIHTGEDGDEMELPF